MIKTLRVKLVPSPQTQALLLQTLETTNLAADYASSVHHEKKPTARRGLQSLVYAELKSRGLSAQPVLLVISKVNAAYATLKANLRAGRYGKPGTPRRTRIEASPVRFRPTAAQPFDDRCLSWNHTARTVSIWTVAGRIKDVPFTGKPEHLALIAAHRQGETDLVFNNGAFYLAAALEMDPAPLNTAPAGFLGVDLGIVNIATTSDGDNWSGGAVTARRKKNTRLRSRLQAKGTRSAKRLLKKRSKKESRFVTDVNHRVSKKIVAEAKRTGRGIAIEDLTGIRARVRLRKPQRAMIHSWAFAQLGAFLACKAEAAGVPLLHLDPAYSSQECSGCGHTEKKNRPDQATFRCLSCGVSLNADENAGRNLAHRGALAWAAITLPHAA